MNLRHLTIFIGLPIITACSFSKKSNIYGDNLSTKQYQSNSEFQTSGKKITVYTTAENTDLRLTMTDSVSFLDAKQPLQTEISVFVQPNNKFQTLLGIGGAITDASAETFAKLNPLKATRTIECLF